MRTEVSPPRNAALAQIRSSLGRAWRWLGSRGPQARLGIGAATLAVLAGAAYLVSVPPETVESAWLLEGQTTSAEDASRIVDALTLAKIPASLGSDGRIAVPKSRKAEARALLDKQKLRPRTLSDLHAAADSDNASPFLWSGGKGERDEAMRCREAEVFISEMTGMGIEKADVAIRRVPSRSGRPRDEKFGAIVRVHLIEGQSLAPQAVESIKAVLAGIFPEVPPEALTILHKSGSLLYDARHPVESAATMAHVTEEVLQAKLKNGLDWIAGLRVLVTVPVPAPNPSVAANTPPAPPVEQPSVSLNAPAEVPDVTPTPAAPPSAPIAEPGKATILVQVPVSYYIRAYQSRNRREPSLDDLKPYAARADAQIRATIEALVSPSEIDRIKIERIDDPGPVLPTLASSDSDILRLRPWVLPALGGGALAVSMMLLVGTRWLVSRRPATVEVPAERHADFAVGDDPAGPSARVRELVRRDPAAAAGTLHRWIGQGQGGHTS